MIIQNLTLSKRTCYEPLASTHPDRQGAAEVTALDQRRRTGHLMTPDESTAPDNRAFGPEQLAFFLRISLCHLSDVRAEDPTFTAPRMLGSLPRWSPETISLWLATTNPPMEVRPPTGRSPKSSARVH